MSDQDISVGGVALNVAPKAESGVPAGDQPTDYLSTLVGEGKKYADPASLAKGAFHANEHISKIEEENKRLREQLDTRDVNAKTIETVLERLTKIDQYVGSGQHHQPLDEQPDPDERLAIPQTREELAAVVRDLLSAQTAEEQAQKREATMKANQQLAWEKLAAVYDNNMDLAKQAVKEYVGDNANRAGVLTTMTQMDPDGFVALLKAQRPADTQFSGVDPAKAKPALDISKMGELTWDVVRKIKAENRKLYESKAFQQAMIGARDRDPGKFWGNAKNQGKLKLR